MNIQERAQKIITEFLQKMSVQIGSLEVEYDPKNATLFCKIQSVDGELLIGSKGAHFEAIDHVLKKILTKGLADQGIKVRLDINNHQEEAIKHLKAKASTLADQAKALKIDVEMEPMTSYERRIVHSFFEGNSEVATESKGEGLSRHIVIRYVKK